MQTQKSEQETKAKIPQTEILDINERRYEER